MHTGKALNFFQKYRSIGTKGNALLKLSKIPFNRMNHVQCSYLIVVDDEWRQLAPANAFTLRNALLPNEIYACNTNLFTEPNHKLSKLNG